MWRRYFLLRSRRILKHGNDSFRWCFRSIHALYGYLVVQDKFFMVNKLNQNIFVQYLDWRADLGFWSHVLVRWLSLFNIQSKFWLKWRPIPDPSFVSSAASGRKGAGDQTTVQYLLGFVDVLMHLIVLPAKPYFCISLRIKFPNYIVSFGITLQASTC